MNIINIVTNKYNKRNNILYDYFNFNKIYDQYEYNKIREETKINDKISQNFLYTHSNIRHSRFIEKFGDIFFGIKNDEPFDITFSLFLNNNNKYHFMTRFLVKSGEYTLLSNPIIIGGMNNINIYYYIEKYQVNFNLCSYIKFKIDNLLCSGYNVKFLYGEVTDDIRNFIFNKIKCFDSDYDTPYFQNICYIYTSNGLDLIFLSHK